MVKNWQVFFECQKDWVNHLYSKNTELDYSVKCKLNGKWPNPISIVKDLGIFLDEHL